MRKTCEAGGSRTLANVQDIRHVQHTPVARRCQQNSIKRSPSRAVRRFNYFSQPNCGSYWGQRCCRLDHRRAFNARRASSARISGLSKDNSDLCARGVAWSRAVNA